ncbi:hypothetical protein MCOR27_000195 [Pyricularia oryzae]|uniref:Ankyrin n=2 Tax=Pyricularia TaxID=48558 RepID=A0ABQ8P1N2_PYRGI|nr:uncharacterized protein MGG_03292 [Pyricularia oryzae 70-15]KAH8843907.1 hypothetical protein MCOR01_004685 [Pyricularia oryzae]KAI6305007.1 hypothetical protein MCOR33_000127 [Pyricularia grisea]EHA50350.1 hypothetical protein MGG_03292 [Pyricularia oryzae 70-15]KAH9431386.1 hypothetical protein MCOR02_008677 [Pyricularia oryzae]KAI6261310.1 hypothetical protein MCOR19_002479 [Pyricularia oryzae]
MSNTEAPPPAAKIGRPAQWNESKSRKLARLYMYTTLPIEKIIKALDDGFFKPGRNSAQKTLNKMLGHDPRYLRPEGREEMNDRIKGLAHSTSRRRSRTDTSRTSPEINSPIDRGDYQACRDKETMVENFGLHPLKTQPDELRDFKVESPSDYSPTALTAPSPGVHSLNAYSPAAYSPYQSHNPWHRSQMSPLHIDTSSGAPTPNTPSGIESHASYPDALFVPKPLAQSNTVLSSSTTATTASIRDLKERLSMASTTFAKQVSSLIRQWTIGSETNLPLQPHSGAGKGTDPDQIEVDMWRRPLPGEFFKAIDMCDQDPDNWQEIADMIYCISDFWLLPNSKLSDMARQYLEKPTPAALDERDCFGNTLLHLFGTYVVDASDCDYVFRKMIWPATTEQLCATNTGGQTFLHVLAKPWFLGLEESTAALLQLLSHVQVTCPKIFTQCDVYGQTFFHHMQSTMQPNQTGHAAMSTILQMFDKSLMPQRDAFGSKPIVDSNFAAPRRQHIPPLSPLAEEMGSPTSSIGAAWPGQDSPSERLAKHTALMKIVTGADNNPSLEDEEGRNCLHCLAEVILDSDKLQEKCASPSNSRRPPKRAYDQKGTEKSPKQGPGDKTVDNIISQITYDGPLASRLKYLRGLLSCPGIDPNHYSKDGNTVLMAFIQHLTDVDEDKHRNLAAILNTLIDVEGKGRGPILEARNRNGETPLLMAARLGRKTALKTLLERGANVHARDVNKRGILDIIDEQLGSVEARQDTTVYGRLEACRVLLTGRYKEDWAGGDEVCQKPSILDEWQVKKT